MPLNGNRGSATAIEKIVSIQEMAARCAAMKAAGEAVVLAHGVFDLLHLGHVRHLEAARELGDRLFVTITADAFVDKGPGRPVFPEAQRAEMLAALSIVDCVAVNASAGAATMLRRVAPTVYAKGSEYRDAGQDITGRITDEVAAVEDGGGSIAFTDEIVFSSSELLNRHFSDRDPHAEQFLKALRAENAGGRLEAAIDAAAGLRVLCVGETIIDEYEYVTPIGRPSKENIVATQYADQESFAGGVVASARQAAAFCGQVEVVTELSDDDPNLPLVKSSLPEGVRLTRTARPGFTAVRKRRFVDPAQMRKAFEVYYMDDRPADGPAEDMFLAALDDALGRADLVVVNDFGHGLLGPRAIALLEAKSAWLAVNAQTNAGNMGYNAVTKFRRADFLCVDEPEARLAAQDKYGDLGYLIEDVLPRQMACDRIVVTRGRYGCLAWEKGHDIIAAPAFSGRPVDTIGAGDAFLAASAPLLAAGGTMRDAAFIGNIVGGIKVGTVGHRGVAERVSVLKAIRTLLK